MHCLNELSIVRFIFLEKHVIITATINQVLMHIGKQHNITGRTLIQDLPTVSILNDV